MSEMPTVEVRFPGEKLTTHVAGEDVYTLYRTPEGLFRIHIAEGEGGLAWLESGHYGEGLEERRVRALFPELVAGLEA